MNKIISSDVLVAQSQCPRKAYLLLCTNEQGQTHEYMRILAEEKTENQQQHIKALRQKQHDVQPYAAKGLSSRSDFLVEAKLQAEGLEADCGLLVRTNGSSALGQYSYEPVIFTGTHTVTKEQKLELLFAGHVLAQIQQKQPSTGRIISMSGQASKVKLEDSHKTLIPLLEPLQEWAEAGMPEETPIILNKHCPLCQFRSLCRAKAEQEDNLSLLDRVTPKVIRQYERKGIFTVKQLSYLYKPRKRKKRARNPPQPTHKLELQALAIRTEKIYLQELPELTRQPVELFLDIEGVPDRGLYYLMGLLVCEGETSTTHTFWADSDQDEGKMWQGFLAKVNQYPDAPIYHYGSYEPRAIAKLARRYESNGESLTNRLVNINNHIYGKVYFPVRSNSLKTIGEFIGATWTSADASGLQSLVWRHHWDGTQSAKYKGLLVTYNEEDCQALKLLTDELARIKHLADTLSEVDFANQPKRHTTEVSKQVHDQFEAVLKFAHISYDKKKISFRQNSQEDIDRKQYEVKKKYRRKVIPKANKVIQVQQQETCPKHETEPLRFSERISKRRLIDLISTKNGIRKAIIEFVGGQGYCTKCQKYHIPPDIRKIGINQFYGRGIKAWVVYQRVAVRVPYELLSEALEEQFNEKIPAKSFVTFIKDFSKYYAGTEEIITQQLLKSQFVHVDETPVNIQGINQYVWVFTNENYVFFRLTETREATIVHEFFSDYKGVLISDFYPGYDSICCKQQKCWVHLVRELNDDLWKTPFDTEYEKFVVRVKNLIIPIMETIQKYGLKKRNLNKFKKQVDEFYQEVIVGKNYKSELTLKYQKRFVRYCNSLFTFLEEDNIPWHNNTAERAIRQLIKQQQISGYFHASVTKDYLLLLGIRQTCRFQGKSFFKFLGSMGIQGVHPYVRMT
jgi:predicted RecB family nuclease